MGEVTIVALDMTKTLFQAHGVDAAGTIIIGSAIFEGNSFRCVGSHSDRA
jgi:hypothetical protein